MGTPNCGAALGAALVDVVVAPKVKGPPGAVLVVTEGALVVEPSCGAAVPLLPPILLPKVNGEAVAVLVVDFVVEGTVAFAPKVNGVDCC